MHISPTKGQLISKANCQAVNSFKSVVIFTDFVLISAKMTTLFTEMRIAELSS